MFKLIKRLLCSHDYQIRWVHKPLNVSYEEHIYVCGKCGKFKTIKY